jgi:hypothetical protein
MIRRARAGLPCRVFDEATKNGQHRARAATGNSRGSRARETAYDLLGDAPMNKRRLLFVIAIAAAGCRTRPFDTAAPAAVTSCTDATPTCIAAPNGCDAPATVAAVCDASGAWSCPAGARPYERAPAAADCVPFEHERSLAGLGSWGLSNLVRVPTDDGRCLWIAESATLADGTQVRNLALEPDRTAPFGTCPDQSLTPPAPAVTVEGGADPSLLVQIDGGYRLAGATRVLYRLFKVDASAAFGVTELGGGLATWDGAARQIVIPSPSSPFPWGLDLDLGDASLDAGDGAHQLVLGCARPGFFLEQGCELARLDAGGAVELLGLDGAFHPTVDATQGAVLFGSGTWQSSLVRDSGGLRHVYIADFGSSLESHVASAIAGPWSDGPRLAACHLPGADAKAFCAGPIVHPELADPTRPGELAVSYSIGTTGPGTGTPRDYFTRLVWLP